MRAVVCTELGSPEKLVIEDRPDFAADPGVVVVGVRAAGLNFVDTLFIQGLYQIKPEPPFVPGSEIAGVVEAVGEGVEGFEPGDRVMAMTGLNGFAEQAALAPQALRRIPDGLDFERAAGFIQSYCTSLHALRDRGELRSGETVLVLGAAGGVGMAAIDIAKAMGARVIAAASSEEKRAACREQGADEVIDYTSEDLKLRAKELSGGGVDVVYDPVGGDHSELALRALAPGGRHLVIGFAAGEIPRVPFNLVLLKQCQVVGVDWGGWNSKHHDEGRALLDDLGLMVSEGELRPRAPQARPLERTPEALRDLMERRVVGKAVVTVEGREAAGAPTESGR
jgi:NADPH2:quinone reductase